MPTQVAVLAPLDTDVVHQVQHFMVQESRGAGWQGQAVLDPAPGHAGVISFKHAASTAFDYGLAPGSPVVLSMIAVNGSDDGQTMRVWPGVVAKVVTKLAEERPVNDVRFCDPLTYLGTRRIWGAFANESPAAILGGAMSLAVGGDGQPTQEPELPGLPGVRIVADLNGALDTIPYAIAVGETLGVWLARLLPRLGIRVETTTGADGKVELTLRDGNPAGEILPVIATYGSPSYFGAQVQEFRNQNRDGERAALLDNQSAGDVIRLGEAGVVGHVFSAAGVSQDEGRRRAGFAAKAEEVDQNTLTVVTEQFQAHAGGRMGFIASSAFGQRTFQVADVVHSFHGTSYSNSILLQKDETPWHPPIPANDGPSVVSGVIDDAESAPGTAVSRDVEGRVPVRLAMLPRLAGENGDAVFSTPRARLPIVNPMGGGEHGFVHAHRQGDLCRVMVHQPLFAEVVGFGYRDDRRLSADFADVSTGLTVRADDEGWAGLVFLPKEEMEKRLGEWDQLEWGTLERGRRATAGVPSALMQESQRTAAFRWQESARASRYPFGWLPDPADLPAADPKDVAESPEVDAEEVLEILARREDRDLDPDAMRALAGMQEELDAAGLREAVEELGVDTAGLGPAGVYAAARREVDSQRSAGAFGAALKLAAVIAAFVVLASAAAAAILAKFPFLATNTTLEGLAASGAAPPGTTPASALSEPHPLNVDQATADSIADQLDAQRDPLEAQRSPVDPDRPGNLPRRGDESDLYRRASDELRRGNDPLYALEDELQQARLRELAREARYPGDVAMHENVRDVVKAQLVAAGGTNLITATKLLQPRVPADWNFMDAWDRLLKALDDVPLAAAAPAVLLLSRRKVGEAAGGLRKLLPGKRPDKEDAGAVREAVEELREQTEDPDQALALQGALNHFDAVAHHSISEGLSRVDAYQPRPKTPLPADVDKESLLSALERNRERSKEAAERYMADREPGEANRFRELTAAYSLAIREVKSDYHPIPALREELGRIERNAAHGELFFPEQHPVYEQAVENVTDVLRENGVGDAAQAPDDVAEVPADPAAEEVDDVHDDTLRARTPTVGKGLQDGASGPEGSGP